MTVSNYIVWWDKNVNTVSNQEIDHPMANHELWVQFCASLSMLQVQGMRNHCNIGRTIVGSRQNQSL